MTSRDPGRCYEAVRSAILATAWLLVSNNQCDSSELGAALHGVSKNARPPSAVFIFCMPAAPIWQVETRLESSSYIKRM